VILSEIGASTEKMCKIKNASFFLNLRKRKLHVAISPDLYDFCGHLKLSCLGKTPRKRRYKFKTFSNTYGQFSIFDVRKTKEGKNNEFDRNVVLMPRLDFKIFRRAAMADSEK